MDSFTTHEVSDQCACFSFPNIDNNKNTRFLSQDFQVCSFFRPEPSAVEPELKNVRSRLEALEAELAESQRQLSNCLEQNAVLKDENERVKKDQEDLLVLLADQDGQVLKYKDRLKNLGQTVYLLLICWVFKGKVFFFFLNTRSLMMRMKSWTNWQMTLTRSFIRRKKILFHLYFYI